ncbi:hypothetical protein [Cecembia lonarensis]|nr:hypothetical protein [Cecembia lonarensis]
MKFSSPSLAILQAVGDGKEWVRNWRHSVGNEGQRATAPWYFAHPPS